MLALALTAALGVCSALAQTPPEVLKAFRKLQADTEAGVTFSQYARGMADVNTELRSFADNNQGRPTPETIKALQSAFDRFQEARALWDEQQVRDMKYQNADLGIKEYFDGKRAITEQIREQWRLAGVEIDRAAKALKR